MNNMQLTIESSTTSMDLNDHQTGIYLVPELDGMTGLPEIRTSSGVNAGYDGGWTSAQNYDARLITIRGVIAHPVVSTVETIRRQLVSLVGQGRKEALTLRLTTEAGNVYTVFVRTIACTMALQRVLTSQEFQIQFRADDPLIYDDGASSGTAGILRVQRALGGFEINFNLPLFIGGGSTGTPIENGGSETVYPIINLYGPLHSPTVINSTTNQQMQLLADLAYEDNWQTPATASGSAFQITGIEGAPLTLTELKGNATQTTYSGKNLLNADTPYTFTGYFSISSMFPDIELNTDYTISVGDIVKGGGNNPHINLAGGAGWFELKPNTSKTFRWTSQPSNIYIYSNGASASDSVDVTSTISNLMLEKSSTKTDYEPYVGGTASPNPDYPQDIQVLTGDSTIAIDDGGDNSQEYVIPFGDTYLAAIGDYADELVKVGDTWYIRRAVGKAVLDGSETGWAAGAGNRMFFRNDRDYALAEDNDHIGTIMSDNFTAQTYSDVYYANVDYGVALAGSANRLAIRNKDCADLTTFKTWLASNPTTVYYALATPTTTEITNTTLLSQLNFIANLYGGTNNITLVGTGAQGEIGVEYMTENDIRRDVAVVDSQARTITINGSDAYHLKADGSEFITIAPGTNDMTLTSAQTSDEGYAEIKYKQGYLSI